MDGKPLTTLTEHQKRRHTDNQEKIKEEWRKKKEGATLGEKIKGHLAKIKKKEIVSHLIDTFYQRIEENGTHY